MVTSWPSIGEVAQCLTRIAYGKITAELLPHSLTNAPQESTGWIESFYVLYNLLGNLRGRLFGIGFVGYEHSEKFVTGVGANNGGGTQAGEEIIFGDTKEGLVFSGVLSIVVAVILIVHVAQCLRCLVYGLVVTELLPRSLTFTRQEPTRWMKHCDALYDLLGDLGGLFSGRGAGGYEGTEAYIAGMEGNVDSATAEDIAFSNGNGWLLLMEFLEMLSMLSFTE